MTGTNKWYVNDLYIVRNVLTHTCDMTSVYYVHDLCPNEALEKKLKRLVPIVTGFNATGQWKIKSQREQ